MMKLMNGNLALALCFSLLSLWNTQSFAATEPEIIRGPGVEAKIDSENFELSTYVGALSLVDFGVNATYGIRADYHLTEDFFFEFNYGMSQASETKFETLNSVTLLSDSERDVTMLSANVGWHFMPGETFLTENMTLTTQMYTMFGLGKVNFAGTSETMIDLGLGYRALVSDWLALRLDFKDHLFSIDVLGDDAKVHNFEATLGLSFFF